MGNLTSHKDKKEEDQVGEEDGMKTPIPTKDGLLKVKPFLIDPRSPTIGVTRTPVEVVAERERMRQDRAKKLQTLGLANTNESTTPTAMTPNAFFDPRSPTFDYKRTPIALEKESEEMDVDQSMTPKGNENELQVPNLCRGDLRKRLFVSQLNDSLNVTEVQDENKEN